MRLRMPAAIQFERESRFGAEEIKSVFADWFLSAKLQAAQFSVSERFPEQPLCISGLLSKIAGAGDRVGGQALTPALSHPPVGGREREFPLLPLPPRGRGLG